jgi:hypothetical protein
LNEFNTTVLSAYHLSHFATNLRARWLAPFTREFSSSTSSLRWSRALFWLQNYHIMCNISKSIIKKMFFYLFWQIFFHIHRSRIIFMMGVEYISFVSYYVGDKQKVFPNTIKNSLFSNQYSARIISISIATELLYISVKLEYQRLYLSSSVPILIAIPFKSPKISLRSESASSCLAFSYCYSNINIS